MSQNVPSLCWWVHELQFRLLPLSVFFIVIKILEDLSHRQEFRVLQVPLHLFRNTFPIRIDIHLPGRAQTPGHHKGVIRACVPADHLWFLWLARKAHDPSLLHDIISGQSIHIPSVAQTHAHFTIFVLNQCTHYQTSSENININAQFGEVHLGHLNSSNYKHDDPAVSSETLTQDPCITRTGKGL